MKKVKEGHMRGVIEDASIHDVFELFRKKPHGLKFNDTDAVVVTAKAEDGSRVSRTFYCSMKPDGTFDVGCLSGDGGLGRRRRLAAFLNYYGLADRTEKGYRLKDSIGEWKGKRVEVVQGKGPGYIYIP